MMSVKLLIYIETKTTIGCWKQIIIACDNYENANIGFLTRNCGVLDLIYLVIFLEKLKVDMSDPCRLMEVSQNQRMIIVKSATRSIMENLSTLWTQTKCVILRLTCVFIRKIHVKIKNDNYLYEFSETQW